MEPSKGIVGTNQPKYATNVQDYYRQQEKVTEDLKKSELTQKSENGQALTGKEKTEMVLLNADTSPEKAAQILNPDGKLCYLA
ncbi:hypothetical protein IJI31_00030 [bacterium]|nr:hypothetical protein [bacterium]